MPGAAQARPRSHRQQRPAGLGVHIYPRVAWPSPPRHRTCPRRGPPGPRARHRAAGSHIMHPAAAHCQGRKAPDTDPALIPPAVQGPRPRPGPSSASTVTASPRYQSAVVRQMPWSRPVHPERVWSRNHLAQAARSRTGSHRRPSATRRRETAADTGDALRRSAPRNRNMLPSGPAELAPPMVVPPRKRPAARPWRSSSQAVRCPISPARARPRTASSARRVEINTVHVGPDQNVGREQPRRPRLHNAHIALD
jgi:hypothetical protein